ncbi:MAG: PIG-L family deacetylase [Verrucomicrobiota bacterium]
MMRYPRTSFLLALLTAASAFAQRPFTGSAEVRQALDRLNVVGSVLMIAAHPDDENNNLLVYLGRGKKYRTAYLSLTRGEGGQNLIGSEQGDEIGLIRTQELLGARRWDAGEQYFSRAIDFGFSKTADETLQKWGRDNVLADVVYNIRRYRPDVIITRFSGTPRDGHGHHQSSAILAKEAFEAAADPARFPEQLKLVQPWRAKRIVFNLFAFNRQMEEENAKNPAPRVALETGGYDPVLGYSYGEIAGISRSNHKSQAFGSAERRGAIKAELAPVAGDVAQGDLFDGVDATWSRVKGGAEIGALLAKAAKEFQDENPAAILPHLIAARQLAAANTDWWAQYKLPEIDEAIALCAGLFAEVRTDREHAAPGATLKLTVDVMQRLPYGLRWTGVKFDNGLTGQPSVANELPLNAAASASVDWNIPKDQAISQPYWMRDAKNGNLYAVDDLRLLGLADSPPVLTATLSFADAQGRTFALQRPARYRFVDPVQGEQVRRLLIVPPVALKVSDAVMVFPDSQSRSVAIEVKANVANAAGTLRLKLPDGWIATPAEHEFKIAARNEMTSFAFTLKPPAWSGKATLEAVATMADGSVTNRGAEVVRYPHIPPQSHFPPAQALLVRADVKISIKRVGYVMGAGDEMPAALRQLGLQVDLLSPEDVAAGELGKYDSIVVGVRAFNTRPDLKSSQARLMEYVKNGGTMIVQYNTPEGFGGPGARPTPVALAPYPLSISRDRVTVEEVPVRFPDKENALLNKPNKITGEDFSGWVQERGLYFVTDFGKEYTPLFGMNDPGEKELLGGTVAAKYGKGTYIYTSLVWFRELPAGVPGAFRIFANFLSAGK